MNKFTRKMIALRTKLTRDHVLWCFHQSIVFSLNIKRIRLMFRLSTKLPSRTARTHAACVSLSFFNDVKQRGSFY
jgi:hypothetical protein